MTIYQVKDQPRFVIKIAEYTNGVDTTGGFYTFEQVSDVTEYVVGITYDAEHCTELPVDWYNSYVLDDRDKRLKITELDFGSEDPYVMEDGYRSKEVTI